jgi:LysR family transcriptional regulator, transcriptional activator of the cysJI operon
MGLPKIESYHLIVFYYVAKEKSMSAAADQMYLSQPTITRHIKSLEESTNLKLIEINKQKVILTSAGEGLFQYAKEIYQQNISADRYVELMKESSIHIGITPIFNSIVAPLFKTMFNELYPKVKMVVQSIDSQSMTNYVLDSSVDIAIIPSSGQMNPKLSYIHITDDLKLVFYAAPNHPIFEQGDLEWKDILKYALIVGPEYSILKQCIGDKLKQEGLNEELLILGPEIEGGNLDLTTKMIKNGEFLGLGLAKDIEGDLNKATLKIVHFGDDISIKVNVVTHRNILISPIIKRFISLARKAFNTSPDFDPLTI